MSQHKIIFTRSDKKPPFFVKHDGKWRQVLSITNLEGVSYHGNELVSGFNIKVADGEYISVTPESEFSENQK